MDESLHRSQSIQRLQDVDFCEGGDPSLPEEEEEVPLLNRDQTLSLLKEGCERCGVTAFPFDS